MTIATKASLYFVLEKNLPESILEQLDFYQDTADRKHYVCCSQYDGYAQYWILWQKPGQKTLKDRAIIFEQDPYQGYTLVNGERKWLDKWYLSPSSGHTFRNEKHASSQIPGYIVPLWSWYDEGTSKGPFFNQSSRNSRLSSINAFLSDSLDWSQ